jgi:hypothetical protein
MTKRLEQGIDAVRALPTERQDVAGEVLLTIAAQHEAGYVLTPEQIADVQLALAEAEQGKYASEAEMEALWKKSGL